MDLIECYLATSRVALRADCTDPSTWQEMHALLPSLHERLSCLACRRLPADRSPAHGIDGLAACSACSDRHQTAARGSEGSIARCYKKLCAYIQQSPLYDVMCARHEDDRLVELLTEAIGASRPPAAATAAIAINGRDGPADDRGMTNGRGDAAVVGTVGRGDDAAAAAAAAAASTVGPIDPSSSSAAPGVVLQPTASGERVNLQIFNVQAPHGNGFRSHPVVLHGVLPRKKKNERGCRCGNATSTPGKLTCFGQRCPCYTEQKPCDRCKCRGCRNPRQKRSNNDDNLEIDKIRRKPVTLELVSSLKPSHFKSKPVFSSYTMHDVLQFPTHGQNYDQGGAEVTLGHLRIHVRTEPTAKGLLMSRTHLRSAREPTLGSRRVRQKSQLSVDRRNTPSKLLLLSVRGKFGSAHVYAALSETLFIS